MSIIKEIICLANSRKLGGCCVAGKEIKNGKPVSWIRPVSSRENEELYIGECMFKDGNNPQALDIIRVPLFEPKPKGYQKENWLLAPNALWRKAGRLNWKDLQRFTDPIDSLWINNYSTFSGLNDKIPKSHFEDLGSSICMILVDDFIISVVVDYGKGRRIRVQGRFTHNSVEYRLWVTDRKYEQMYRSRSEGEYEIGRCFLTISLGEPYGGACYKLVAAIIEPGA